MERLPPITGWHWIKQGFSLFRRQPLELATMFLAYMLLMMVAGKLIPVIGQAIPLLLVPTFTMAFMQACVQIERGKRVGPSLLMTGFRSPSFPRLLVLGALYIVAGILALGFSALIDGGVFWKVMTGSAPVDPAAVQGSGMPLAMLVSALLFVPAAMAFWYSAPLIAWQNMGLGKALFYSFFAVRRSGKAFLVYGLGWLAVGVLAPVLISTILALLLGNRNMTMLILLPTSIIMTIAMYCSFFPNYTAVFGPPQDEPPAPSTPPALPPQA